MNAWNMLYGIPERILADNGPERVGKIFDEASGALAAQRMTITTNRPGIDFQNKRYNIRIIEDCVTISINTRTTGITIYNL